MLKISDSQFLAAVAQFMVDGRKRDRIFQRASVSGQYDEFQMLPALRDALEREAGSLSHTDKQQLGFYHSYPQRDRVSRVWLDRWAARFPSLEDLICLTKRLRPVSRVERAVPMAETFFDFTVEKHNNYLAGNNGLVVIHNCGIGYEFSTLRPRGAYVTGAGAYTSGPLSFMDIYDKMCFTVSSAGGRRGAQMGTFDVGHPDVLEFIRAKRENGRLRQFNLSLLVTDEFMKAVKSDGEWKLAFPLARNEYESERPDLDGHEQIRLARMAAHRGLRGERGRPGRLQDLQDAAGAAGVGPHHVLDLRFRGAGLHPDRPGQRDEQQLVGGEHPRHQSVRRAAASAVRLMLARLGQSHQDSWSIRSPTMRTSTGTTYRKVVKIFTRMLDNVVEINGLPLEQQRDEIMRKRRHGMGFLGLGSHHHHAVHEVRLEEIHRVHRERVARDGGRRLGSGSRARAREGSRADHERGVHGHARDAAQASRDGEGRLARGREDRGAGAARALQPLHAARSPRSRRSSWTSWPRSARASRTTARSRPPARSRCRSPTTRRTASSLPSRTITSAT